MCNTTWNISMCGACGCMACMLPVVPHQQPTVPTCTPGALTLRSSIVYVTVLPLLCKRYTEAPSKQDAWVYTDSSVVVDSRCMNA